MESENYQFSWKSKLTSALTRRKTAVVSETDESKLARVLGLADLIALGVGSTLGLGVYVLAGTVALNNAGPAVTISFLIAAIASAFAGVCYAEFASRVPKAGSAYAYCYVTVGEFSAFVIGWNLILEYAIGTAAIAKGLSNYVDTLCGNAMENFMKELLPMHVSFMADHPDFFAAFLVLLLTLLLTWGVKESTRVNNIFTVVNLLTVITVIIAGALNSNSSLWNISPENIPKGVKGGNGGFVPFGWSGVMSGAATSFFGFVGFDVIATTGEEAKNPKRNIPLAIVASLIIVFLAYFGVGSVTTMLIPYYAQDKNAPLQHAFKVIGLPTIMWIISIGAICALSASLLGVIFPLPRVLYAMAKDGLLFQKFAFVHERTKTPIFATMFSGILTAIISGLFNLEQLIDMMSIGTLLAYTIVAICILILRYKEEKDFSKNSSTVSQKKSSEKSSVIQTIRNFSKKALNLNMTKYPTPSSRKIALYSILILTISIILFGLIFNYGDKVIQNEQIRNYLLLVLLIWIVLNFSILMRQPRSKLSIPFKVPLVPLVPLVSVVINVYLMLQLDIHTWIRFIIWLIIGFIIFVFYSVNHSVENKYRKVWPATNKNEPSVKNEK